MAPNYHNLSCVYKSLGESYSSSDLYGTGERTIEDQRLDRYLDLKAFVYMLTESALFFKSFRALEDQWEGTVYQDVPSIMGGVYNHTPPSSEEISKQAHKRIKSLKKTSSVLSWYKNSSDTESVALWKIYADNGLLIQSSVYNVVSQLKKKLNSRLPENCLLLGSVEYSSSFQNISEGNECSIFYQKKGAYQFENEYRFIKLSKRKPRNVFSAVNVNLAEIINTIIINPFIPEGEQKSYLKMIQALLRKFDLESIPVRQSSLI